MTIYRRQSSQLDLLDLCREALRYYWFILACMVLGSAIYGAFSYYQDLKAAEEVLEVEETVEEEIAEEEIPEYTAEAAVDVDLAYSYEQQAEAYQEYLDNSIYLQLNPDGVSAVVLQYSIEDTEDASSILNLCSTYVSSGALVTDVVAAGYEAEETYLKELISIGVATTVDARTMTVTVLHVDKDSAQELADCVDAALSDYCATLSQGGIGGTLAIVASHYTELDSTGVLTARTNAINSQINAQDNVNKLKAEFSIYQLQALEQLESGVITSAVDATLEEPEPEQESEPEEELESEEIAVADVKVSLSVKNLLIGAIAGMIVACLIILLAYCQRDPLANVDMLREDYKIRVLGVLTLGCRTNFWVRLWDKLFMDKNLRLAKELQQELLAGNIQNACQERGFANVLLCGAGMAGGQALVEEAVASLGASGQIKLACSQDFVYDAQAVESLSSYDGIILVEQLHVGTNTTLQKELRLCEEREVAVLGAIVLG